jgi:hypothetical protein
MYLRLLACVGVGVSLARELPLRRTRFVASTNGGSSSFQPLADAFIQLNHSYNIASAYCSSPGTITNDTVLPSPPFCYNNWTLPIKQALGDAVYHLPIIQMLGNSGPEKFKIPYIFTRLYVDWAVQWGFDGYLIDAEFKGDDAAYVAFINIFGAGLHAVNKSLGVFLYPGESWRVSLSWCVRLRFVGYGKGIGIQRAVCGIYQHVYSFLCRSTAAPDTRPCKISDMSKAQYINGAPGLDHWLGTWGGKCDTIPNVIWYESYSTVSVSNALHHFNACLLPVQGATPLEQCFASHWYKQRVRRSARVGERTV